MCVRAPPHIQDGNVDHGARTGMIDVRVHPHIYTLDHTHSHTCTRNLAHMQAPIYTYMHVHTHRHAQTHALPYIHTHPQVRAHVQASDNCFFLRAYTLEGVAAANI